MQLRRFAVGLLLAASVLRAQSSGVFTASDFGAWSLPSGITPANGILQWQSGATCNINTNGYNFTAVKVGRPLTIVDAQPAHTETVTPTSVTITGSTCTVAAVMTYTHSTYTVRSGTAGLQEAIDFSAPLALEGGAVIALTPAWSWLGGTSGMISSATGQNGTALLDERAAAQCAYLWNGSSYQASGCGAGNAASLAQTLLQTFAGPLSVPQGITANVTGNASGLSSNITESQVTNLVTDLAGKVSTGATINGVLFSATTVIPASAITTGTLPHAQLPTLQIGDIPNIAESQVTNLVSDLGAKQATISLTTTGTSGAATLIGSTLNIPNYVAGTGTVNAGTLNQIAYYAGAGTAVSGTSSATGLTVDGVTPTTFGYLDPTSSVQTQLNAKQPTISLTTTGSSGAATLVGSTLNIPQYAGGGSMTWPATPGIPVCTGTPCSAWGITLAEPSGAIVGTTDTQVLTNKTVDSLDPTHFGYLLSLTSDAQAQINGKVATTVTVNGNGLGGPVTVTANQIPYGTVSYTTSTSGVTADNGVLVKMNCSAPCVYTLPGTQPSSTWHTTIVSIGSAAATIALGGGDTFMGSTNPPAVPAEIWANTNLATGYLGYSIPATGGSAPVDLGTLAYNAAGTTAFAAASAPNASAIVTATHATSTTFSPTGLVKWGSYTLEIKQDSTGGGVTFTLGAAGTCTAWKLGGGGLGAITLSSSANAIDVLSWTYDGTNCIANFRPLFN